MTKEKYIREEELSSLLQKYVERTISQEEMKELEAYLQEHPKIRAELSNTYNIRSLMESAPQQGDLLQGVKAYRTWKKTTQKKRHMQRATALLKYAAVLALLLLGSYYSGIYQAKSIMEQQVTELVAPTGQRLSMTLSDGTQVHLSPCSRLSFTGAYGKSNRLLSLSGAAFLEVAKDTSKPLIVSTPRGYKVEVTGTKFYVQSDKLVSFEASLLEGGVSVYQGYNRSKKIDLLPGESVTLENGTLRKENETLAKIESRKEGIVQYQSTPLPSVLRDISYWYGVQFEEVSSDLSKKLLSGKIKQGDSLKAILSAISISLGVEFNEVRENTYQVSL